LADLSAAADISKTTLHAIEQGEANPTLGTLWALATALEVSLGELMAPTASAVSVVRSDEGPRVDGDAVHARLLHRIPVRGSVEIYELAIDSTRQESEPHLPGVSECLVVTGGRVAVGPADDPVELETGDAVHFDASSRHCYIGVGQDNRALLVMVHSDR
jgi:transcriptional regulator with XRE-family HTH domain